VDLCAAQSTFPPWEGRGGMRGGRELRLLQRHLAIYSLVWRGEIRRILHSPTYSLRRGDGERGKGRKASFVNSP